MLDTINNYSKSLDVNSNGQQVFKALTEDIHLWWGNTSDFEFREGGRFTILFENGYWWTFKIMEFTPNKELIWKCIAGEPDFNKEWIGHVLHWKIIESDTKTTINLLQIGLTPEIKCYETCSTTWDMFIEERLKQHLETSKLDS